MVSRQIPWTRILVEGAVIVGSILLAFGIDAWWEGRSEAQAEQDILVSLEADFTRNRDEHIIRIDPATGEMLGRVSLGCVGHELAVSPDGALLPGLLCDGPSPVVRFRQPD